MIPQAFHNPRILGFYLQAFRLLLGQVAGKYSQLLTPHWGGHGLIGNRRLHLGHLVWRHQNPLVMVIAAF